MSNTRVCYHTQEKRNNPLTSPIFCTEDDAWLGSAYYFWIDEDDAIFWGNVKKRKTGRYDIYSCKIDCGNILDTVYNEEHYKFWVKNIEKAAKKFLEKTGIKPSLKDINDYFYDKGVWKNIDGIMFQDISKNEFHYFVKQFQYKKRIQIALYNKLKMTTFAHHYTGQCV